MALEDADKKEIQEMIDMALKKSVDFPTRKLGDTPTDDLQLTPRKYTNANGSIASRPIGSVASRGQFYLATDIPTPMWRMETNWINGVGSVIASN